MHDQSVCVYTFYCHINRIRCLSRQHDLRRYRPGFTPNSHLMCPFSLRAMHHVVQPVPHFSVRMKQTSCHKTCFSINNPPRRGCHQTSRHVHRIRLVHPSSSCSQHPLRLLTRQPAVLEPHPISLCEVCCSWPLPATRLSAMSVHSPFAWIRPNLRMFSSSSAACVLRTAFTAAEAASCSPLVNRSPPPAI